MPQVVEPEVRKTPLHKKLAALRFRIRFVAWTRGMSWLLVVLLSLAVVGCTLDGLLHTSSLVRAMFLTTALVGSGVVFVRYLFAPLTTKADDLSLALRIEEYYPSLNDTLASTVQFLDQKLGSPYDSSRMRLEVARRTFALIKNCDFNKIINARGVLSGAILAGFFLLVTTALFAFFPGSSRIAAARMVNPFGGTEWPKLTQIELTSSKSRVGKDKPFFISGLVTGVVPDEVTIEVRPEGMGIEKHTCAVESEEDSFKYRISRAKSFAYRVKANDAVTPWKKVEVLSPPTLVPMGDRASPMVRLIYPEYTDRPPEDRPDGTGEVIAPYGTRVILKAAVDRPIERAWIEFYPDLEEETDTVLFLETFARRLNADLSADHRQLTVEFEPKLRGQYRLHYEDDIGIADWRYFELNLKTDPAPKVELEQPAATKQYLRMLPSAQFQLTAKIEDQEYAVRNVWLEYRFKKDEPGRVISLYDTFLAQLLVDLSPVPGAAALPPLRMRQQQLRIDRSMKVSEFVREKIAPRVGDTILIKIFADDFDNITRNKTPSESHEVEIQIIDQNALDVTVTESQLKLHKELAKLLEQEREAQKKVTRAEANLEKQGKLSQEDLDQLAQAEQLQQQIRERVGKTKEEGLQAEVQRLRDALKNNQLPRSNVHERLDDLAAELDRLAAEELERIEPRLSNARKQQENAPQEPETLKKTRDQLADARQDQRQVEQSLDQLLSRFEEVSSTLEHKGEAKSLLRDQRELMKQVEQEKPKTIGEKPEELSKEAQRELERLRDEQQRLEERTNRLIERLQKQADEKAKTDPATAREMREAVDQARKADITGQMQQAQEAIRKNQLTQALEKQRKTAEELEKLIEKMEEKREQELDRLLKKLKEEHDKLEKLADDQDRLKKKIEEANKIPDPAQRQDALRKLAGEQRALQQQAQKIQDELKQVARLRAAHAEEAVEKAVKEMEKTLQRLERGQEPEQQPEEALERLDQAARELQRAQEDAEEELAREQVAKIAKVIEGFKEREKALIAESERIYQETQRNKAWGRGLRASLRDLGQNQKGLGKELLKLTEEKLSRAVVVAKMLEKASQAMEQAGDRFEQQWKKLENDLNDLNSDEPAQTAQKDALRKLEQVLDSLKQEQGVSQRNAAGQQQPGGGGQGGGGGGGSQRRSDGDAIPELAQLKLLKALQEDVNRLSDDFTKKHPDPDKLTPQEQDELRKIRKQQQEVAELFDTLLNKGNEEGGKP